jgi:hypothetical protein
VQLRQGRDVRLRLRRQLLPFLLQRLPFPLQRLSKFAQFRFPRIQCCLVHVAFGDDGTGELHMPLDVVPELFALLLERIILLA